MFENIIYILLAIIGLGFLVFIHELGHYIAAKKQKMKIEVFSIGFGKPIYSWKRKGVIWQIGIFPFGGFVKIAGMEKKGKKEPYEIKDGFFSKKPIQRIKVAIWGPLVNFIFAILVFTIIWISGGRNKPFSEYTKKIGWIKKRSSLYEKNVRPGDILERYGQRKYKGFKDVIYNAALSKDSLKIEGFKVDYYKNKKIPFNYFLKTYPIKLFGDNSFSSVGIEAPCSYLIYKDFEDKTYEVSPMKNSGIQKNDRIIWADGEVIFSLKHLSNVVNSKTAFLKIKRDGKIIFAKVPKFKIFDLKLSENDLEEIDDLRHDANIKNKLKDLYFLPYFFNEQGIVEKKIDFIDEEDVYSLDARNPFSVFLEKGDKIVTLDGEKIDSSLDILKRLQKKHVQIIVERNYDSSSVSWNKADEKFDLVFKNNDLLNFIYSEENNFEENNNNLFKLNPIEPITLEKFSSFLEKDFIAEEFKNYKQKIKKIENPQEKALALKMFEKQKNRLILGIFSIQDQFVKFNPNPFSLFYTSFLDTIRTLASLISGNLNIKWMAGPIGIVQVVHKSWSLGILEAFFWLGLISLNLGFINLLPIPVLDGGHILFSLYEMITKKRISSKAMERMIIPFVVLLVILFIFITYNDIIRLIKRFF